jgi:hypothetical protein
VGERGSWAGVKPFVLQIPQPLEIKHPSQTSQEVWLAYLSMLSKYVGKHVSQLITKDMLKKN